jgi:hypothetical protein
MPASKIIRLDQLSYYDLKLKNFIANTYATQASIPIVPSTVSSFTNDADYQSGTQVTTAINAAIAGITGISFEIVQTLPATGDSGTIYLVPAGQSATGDIYAEWIYINSNWEKLGSTAVDLTGMVSYDSTNEEFSADNTVIAQYATNLDIDSIFA